MQALVVGGGIIGSIIGYRLTDAGASVTLVDAGREAGGASWSSFAWLGSFPQGAGREGSSERDLRLQVDSSLRAQTCPDIRNLDRELGVEFAHWDGSLTCPSAAAERAEIAAAYERARGLGMPVERISGARALELEPLLRVVNGDAYETYWEPDGGWLDAPALIAELWRRLQERGGRVITNTRVVGMDTSAGSVTHVVTHSGERIRVDCIVNAAGSGASHVAALSGECLPLNVYPGFVVYSERLPAVQLPTRVLRTSTVSVRPDSGDRVAIHWHGAAWSASLRQNLMDPREVLRHAADVLPSLRGTVPAEARVGIRAVPPDGPIIGWQPGTSNAYIVVSHGGVRWGATWGRLAAQEILDRVEFPELAPMRPNRFLATRT